MDPITIGFVAALVVVGALIGADTVRLRREARRIAARQRELAAPPITRRKLVGKVRLLDGRPLRAPLSGRPCAGYTVTATEPNADGTDAVIFTESRCADFAVDDGTRTVLVRAAESELRLVVDATRTQAWTGADAHVVAFLRPRGVATHGWVLPKTIRCTEGVLAAGEPVTVVGVERQEPVLDPSAVDQYRELPTRAVVASAIDEPLLITDDPTLAQ